MQRASRNLLIVLSLLVGLIGTAVAQMPKMATWSAKLESTDIRAGENATIIATIKVNDGWHAYGIEKFDTGPLPTQIVVTPGKVVDSVGATIAPPGHRIKDENFHLELTTYTGSADFRIPIKLKAGLTGKQTIKLVASSQVCNDSTCMPPADDPMTVTFTVAPGEPRPDHQKPFAAPAKSDSPKAAGTQSAAPGASNGDLDQVNKARSEGLLSYLWLAFSAGLLALLTPCVFPMIPITVSFFSKQRSENDKPNYAGAGAYCAGIIATFTALGLIVTLLFGAGGINALSTNPYVNIGLAILFLVLAANLFGLFEIAIPSSILSKIQAKSRRGGLLGPLLMGLAFTLTSFTCTVPFVGTLLVAATTGDLLFPVLGMLAFSTAFSLPFFLLALFPQFLTKLPKSGSWLATVKAFMGFIEIAAAVKFVSNTDLGLMWQVITRPVFLALWGAILAVAALYLLGWLKLGHEEGKAKIGWMRRVFALGTLVMAVLCFRAISGNSLGEFNAFLPPDPYPGAVDKTKDIPWVRQYNEALAVAKVSGKPLFINFTGVFCTNCRWMEQNMFPRDQVKTEIGNFIPVELYTDRKNPDDLANQKLQMDLTKSITLPVYVLVSPEGKVLGVKGGIVRDQDAFLTFLKSAVAPSGLVSRK